MVDELFLLIIMVAAHMLKSNAISSTTLFVRYLICTGRNLIFF
jgi:hypothetical protein